MLINNKFYKYNLLNFKKFIEYSNLIENRVLEGFIFFSNPFYILDFGFKYLTKINKFNITENALIFNILELETIFDDVVIDIVNLKNDINRKLNWSFLKVAFNNKSILSGKILNSANYGYSVGVCGFVGFIYKNQAILAKLGQKSLFLIIDFDFEKKSFTLSQKQINKVVSRIFFKLSSKILNKKSLKKNGEYTLIG